MGDQLVMEILNKKGGDRSGRGAPGAGRGAYTGRFHPGKSRGGSGPSHYGPGRGGPQAHAVSEQAYQTEVIYSHDIVVVESNIGEINGGYS